MYLYLYTTVYADRSVWVAFVCVCGSRARRQVCSYNFFLWLECLHSAHSFCDEWCKSRNRRHQRCVFMRGRTDEKLNKRQSIENLQNWIVWSSDHRVRLIDTPIQTEYFIHDILVSSKHGTTDFHKKRITLQKPFHGKLKGKGMTQKMTRIKRKIEFHSRK